MLLALAGAGIAALNRPAVPHSGPIVATPPSAQRFTSRRTLNLADVGDIGSQLEPSGLSQSEAREISREVVNALGSAPGEIRLILDLERSGETSTLITLEATRTDGTGLMLHRQANGALEAKPLSGDLTRRLTVVRGEIDSNSFYSSAVTAGVTDSLIGEVANAFSYDFDMQREVAPGDVFEVAFEQAYNRANEAVGVPRLAYVSLRTATLSRTLYRFTPPGEREPGWFDGNGASTVRALMRTPVDSARITSQFGMRMHPILGFEKMHRGTDFAAPTGTPVFASGNATVEFAGPKGPNGNFIRLHHDNGWETLYLHLNRILPGVTQGARVAQGQQIGEIGTTGRSTGPHLHYEVHIDGQPVDPLKIDVGTGQTLTGAALIAFHKQRDAIDTQRAGARQP
ncbi:M23 family metallopeptidase [Novosphingobium terrae]|uniref:M23 family metallopeptidase n=1 Tax=Novosphingobium terrae TaxID=2726189 RepID=UPI00197F988E|nr:M23 family metallopeptidase [Novosphingobium terrae]